VRHRAVLRGWAAPFPVRAGRRLQGQPAVVVLAAGLDAVVAVVGDVVQRPDGGEDTQQVSAQDGVVHAQRNASAVAVQAVVNLGRRGKRRVQQRKKKRRASKAVVFWAARRAGEAAKRLQRRACRRVVGAVQARGGAARGARSKGMRGIRVRTRAKAGEATRAEMAVTLADTRLFGRAALWMRHVSKRRGAAARRRGVGYASPEVVGRLLARRRRRRRCGGVLGTHVVFTAARAAGARRALATADARERQAQMITHQPMPRAGARGAARPAARRPAVTRSSALGGVARARAARTRLRGAATRKSRQVRAAIKRRKKAGPHPHAARPAGGRTRTQRWQPFRRFRKANEDG